MHYEQQAGIKWKSRKLLTNLLYNVRTHPSMLCKSNETTDTFEP